MTALELIALVNQILFVVLFVAVAWQTVRRPTPTNLNTALLFAGIAVPVTISVIADWTGFSAPWLSGALIAMLNVSPLAMLRLVDDFRGTPRWVQWAGIAAFMAIAVLSLVEFGIEPAYVLLPTIAWFLGVGGYAAVSFARASRESRGITRWRMAAVSAGAYLFIAAIVVVFAAALVPGLEFWATAVGQILALLSIAAFFIGFIPPAWLRRAWREPSLRVFLERSLHLSGMADDRQLLFELQRAAADTLGATGAAVGVAEADGTSMRYVASEGGWEHYPADMFIAGRAFVQQSRLIVTDASGVDPENAAAYESAGARVVIAVPISTQEEHLGVLTVYGTRAPIFVEDDLWLVQLLADQMAVILEARRMARVAGEVRAREDAALLKEEFLSAAAHDLRTPLTVLLGQAELLERRVQRSPETPVDPNGVLRIARETRRLRDLVSDLLDAQRLEGIGPPDDLEPIDVRELVRAAIERRGAGTERVSPELPSEPVPVRIDRVRFDQVIDNLLENASKYAPGRVATEIRAWREDGEARISVVDHGIGIPAAERDKVFDRFFRASNAQARSDTGLGLGLYICRRIVESHGGRIWVAETPGGGSTFTVSLPVADGSSVGPQRAAATPAGHADSQRDG